MEDVMALRTGYIATSALQYPPFSLAEESISHEFTIVIDKKDQKKKKKKKKQ